jgi:AcrR family transcriptional regulator
VTELLTVAQRKGERTRARLLEIAIRRFAADGFRRTSVSDIAREADLTPAAAYAYFPGKEALFQSAVDADASGLIEEARDAAGLGGFTLDRLLVFLVTLRERLEFHPLARRVLAGLEPEVIGRLMTIPSLVELTAAVAELLADAQAAGEVRDDVDPAALAIGLETILLSLLLGEVQTGLAIEPERQAGVVAVLEAALRPVR